MFLTVLQSLKKNQKKKPVQQSAHVGLLTLAGYMEEAANSKFIYWQNQHCVVIFSITVFHFT